MSATLKRKTVTAGGGRQASSQEIKLWLFLPDNKMSWGTEPGVTLELNLTAGFTPDKVWQFYSLSSDWQGEIEAAAASTLLDSKLNGQINRSSQLSTPPPPPGLAPIG